LILFIDKGEETKMKTIGLIGGMSWESTVTYYKIVNETVKKELGGFKNRIQAIECDFFMQ